MDEEEVVLALPANSSALLPEPEPEPIAADPDEVLDASCALAWPLPLPRSEERRVGEGC